MAYLQRISNCLFIYLLCFIVLGSYLYQFVEHEEPCPLCLLQRLGMIGIASALLMNVYFGIKVEHYGLAILAAILSTLVSLRQISLHVCPSFPTFGEPVLGLDLYVWAFVVFSCSILVSAILLMIYGFNRPPEQREPLHFLEKTALYLVGLITFGNVIISLLD